MTLNFICEAPAWDNIENSFIAITPRSTLT